MKKVLFAAWLIFWFSAGVISWLFKRRNCALHAVDRFGCDSGRYLVLRRSDDVKVIGLPVLHFGTMDRKESAHLLTAYVPYEPGDVMTAWRSVDFDGCVKKGD